MKEITVRNYTCVIGENAKENWSLLDKSKDNYLFFHLSSFPSCYVILQTEEKVDNNIIIECAEICLASTKYKNLRNVYVDYTLVSNLRKGDKIGEVIYVSKRKVSALKIKIH